MEYMLTLDDASSVPLYRQVYDQLRQAILGGRFRPGDRLPSTRALAASLDVARITVEQGYEQLAGEGYLESRPGSGRYVARPLPDDLLIAAGPAPRPHAASVGAVATSAWAARLMRNETTGAPGGLDDPYERSGAALRYDFRPGATSRDAFPASLWRRLLARQWRKEGAGLLVYGEAAGYEPLREAIASYLQRARGVRCAAEQVVITSGTTQAVDLLTRLTVDSGDTAILEDPGFPGARALLTASGARLLLIPVDRHGLCVEALPPVEEARGVRLIYVTPSHQYPLGGTLPLPRRLALLRWAAATGAILVEDDYDSEFRYSGRPVTALQGLDDAGLVVYIGTFSKVLSPGLRLGYVVLPPRLLRPFVAAKRLADRHTPALEQRALADFILEGHFERHLRRLRTLYRSRQNALLGALQQRLGSRCSVEPAAAGMHLVVHLAEGLSEDEVARAAAAVSVGVYPLSRFHPTLPQPPTLLLGYTGLDDEAIRAGVSRLARAWSDLDRSATDRRSPAHHPRPA
jgi:GntR family transcriptional regulator/MocR family aminotransferase